MASSVSSGNTPSDQTVLSSPKEKPRVLIPAGIDNPASAEVNNSPTQELSASSEKEPEPKPELNTKAIIEAWRWDVKKSTPNLTHEISSGSDLSEFQVATLQKVALRVEDCIVVLGVENGLGHNWGGILSGCISLFKGLFACIKCARSTGRYFQTCPEVFGKKLTPFCGKAIEYFYSAELQSCRFVGPRPNDVFQFVLAEDCAGDWGLADFTTDLNCLMRKYQAWDRELIEKIPAGPPPPKLELDNLDAMELRHKADWGKSVNKPYRPGDSHLATFCLTEKVTVKRVREMPRSFYYPPPAFSYPPPGSSDRHVKPVPEMPFPFYYPPPGCSDDWTKIKVGSAQDKVKANLVENKDVPKPEASWAATASQEEIGALMARMDVGGARLASSTAQARLVWPEHNGMVFPPDSSNSESNIDGGDASDSEEEDLGEYIGKLLASQPALRAQPIGPREESRIEKYLRLTATPENTSPPNSGDEDGHKDGNLFSTSSDNLAFRTEWLSRLDELPIDDKGPGPGLLRNDAMASYPHPTSYIFKIPLRNTRTRKR